MIDAIQFIVPCVPVAQPRQRHRVITSGGKSFAHNYTPTKDPVNAFKAAVQMAANQAYQGPPLDGPLWASFVFVMPRPKSMCWKKRPMPRVLDPRKPDRDNLMKSLQDALEGLLFGNDCMIAAGPVEKWIASGDEQPHVAVSVRCVVPTGEMVVESLAEQNAAATLPGTRPEDSKTEAAAETA